MLPLKHTIKVNLMKNVLVIMALMLMLFAGCVGETPPADTPDEGEQEMPSDEEPEGEAEGEAEDEPEEPAMTCQEYCQDRPHAMCVGHWEISGTYPDCVCNWVCEQTEEPEEQQEEQPEEEPQEEPKEEPQEMPKDEGQTHTEGAAEIMSLSEAMAIAGSSDCRLVGVLDGENYVYNENTKTWWIDIMPREAKEGCNPACVIDVESKTAEVNWRCTGLEN
jgi:hypothetical protein